MYDMSEKKTRSLTFRTTDDVVEDLEGTSKQEDRTVSWLIDRAVRDWLAWRKSTRYTAELADPDGPPSPSLWAKLSPVQRRLIAAQIRSGALEVREGEPPPVLNEPGGQS